ncbi:DUF3168 domain-containing protein [Pseudomonas sp. JS3066]|uniref:DUF3168 domain-containing protein n=1 Tax=Pseudomonas sp. JS3066 TaxID=3090665 RepID=UPI002E7B41C8|nr:DUF3168 domain-containing protein [Pseudomonas sp. JS3066]WVK91139.1 DUF3168 domain-containing protein [Pseudomonas sp. JS3066]
MIELDLRAALLAHAPLTALVQQKVAALIAPEGTQPPYVTYQLITGTRQGSMSTQGSLRNARMQLLCFARSYGEAKQVAQAVQDAVEDSTQFEVVFNGDQDLYEPDTKLQYVVLDYSIWQDT